MPKRYLAIDLGAESGRAVLGSSDGNTVGLEEIHRFPNEPVRTGDELHWDMLRLWHETQKGIRAAAGRGLTELDGIGVDTWGVDFALLGERGTLLGNPYHYRDVRTDGTMERVFARVPADEIYAETGIQFMQLNSLFQLFAAAEQTPKLVDLAEHFLTVPDLLNYWLSGVMATEFTIASTTQMYNPVTKDWARGILERLVLPTRFLKPIVQPGTALGPLKPELLCGLKSATLIAPACHDTGSAVAAIPLSESTIYISSGTWSLMGAEIPAPIISDEARRLNFTNEGGVGGTIRLLKNIMGMWLLQGCRRKWASEGHEYDYGTLVGLAGTEPVLRSIVEPDDDRFLRPEDMTAAIAGYCERTRQPVPSLPGEFVQVVLESLALKYRYVVECLERITGRKYTDIRVVGGGSRNRVLNQFTADATGCRVTAGPIEATALGNIAMQMVGTGAVASIAEARSLIDRSFPTETFEPRDRARWDAAYIRIRQIAGAAASGH
jgi:rhamnulokinase